VINYIAKPIDLILFGSPSPFNSTEQTYRSSDFILNPIPFYGAMRKYNKNISFDYISLIKREDFLFPLPFDIVEVKGKYSQGKLKKISIKELISDSLDDYQIIFDEGKFKRHFDKYIPSYHLEEYLCGKEDREIRPITPFETEKRIGIKINREKKTTEEGYLYFEDFVRLEKGVSFYIKTDGDLQNKILKIGGEARMVMIEKFNKDIDAEFVNQDRIKKTIKETGLFKLILLTPTNAPCNIQGAKMISKITGRPYVYSGWLRKKNRSFPSKLFRLIRPGAVFYYRIEDKNRDDFVKGLFNRFWLKPGFFKPDFPYFENKEGINPLCLGLTIIGTVKESTIRK